MELDVLYGIQTYLQSPLADRLMVVLSTSANHGKLWIGISLLLCMIPKWRKAGVVMFLSLVCAHLVGNVVLKNLVGRTRPFVTAGYSLLIPPINEYSFPSGHAITSFAAAFSLPRKWRVLRSALLLVAVAIAFSRLYLFVHYPTDVLGGALLGMAIGHMATILGNEKWVWNVDKNT